MPVYGRVKAGGRMYWLSGLLSGALACASQITVQWEDNSSNETSFKIERALADLPFAQIATVGANVSMYTDTTVLPSTTYSYRVRASNANNDSDYSNVMIATAPAAGASAPIISNLGDMTINEGKSTGPVGFTVNDLEVGPDTLVVTAFSSNPALLPNSGIVLGGGGANRNITILPSANQSGTATITLAVNDGTMTAFDTFLLTVNPADGSPTISDIPNQATSTGIAVGPIEFTIGGVDTSSGSLSLSGESSNPTLVPNDAISFGGSGANRTITIIPAAGRNGSATIIVSLTEGSLAARSSFVVTVGPGSARTFTNSAQVGIVDTLAGIPYPSPITVTGLGGTITSVTIQLNRLNHSWAGDVDLLLVSPTGRKILLMSDAGTGPTANATLTFSDAANSSLPQFGAIATGIYRPTDFDSNADVLPPPAPLPPYARTLAPLNGQSASGEWLLYIHDDAPGDGGNLSGGWSLTITTVASGPAAPVLSAIANQTLPPNTSTATLPFTVDDADTPATSVALSGSSSNASLVSNANIIFGGSGSSRTVRVTPTAGQTGASTITVTASDGALVAVSTFTVTVRASTTPSALPTITSPASASSTVGEPFSYRIVATNAPTSFDATNLPTGLVVNTNTGAISGSPTIAGDFEITTRAVNASGLGVATLSLRVNPLSSSANQTVMIQSVSGPIVIGQAVPLRATASSGLPVTFSVVDGNAVVNGSTVTIYDTRGATLRATQGGSADFAAASSVFTLANAVSATGPLIYTGMVGTDFFAAAFDAQNSRGTLYMMLSSTGEGFVVPVSLAADGTFNTTAPGISVSTPTSPGTTQLRTIRGQIASGTLSGTIDELTRTFSATLQSATGPTKSFTAAYTADTLSSVSGTTHLVTTSAGQVYVLSINPTLITAGVGSIAPDGTFTVRTPQSATFEGYVNATTSQVTGLIQFPNQAVAAELLGLANNTPRTSRLINLSSRVRVSESGGSRALISGIVVGGLLEKPMLLRAIGPGLIGFGLEDGLRNPRLQLFDNGGRIVAQNDNWGNLAGITATGDRAGAFRLVSDSLDSALLATINPGVYTLEVSSGGGDGVALVEVYDVSEDLQATGLINLSTRGYIDAGDGAIIAGFVVSGNAPMRVLVRGIGPALGSFGVTGFVSDPVLRIHQNSVLIAQNDNWEKPEPVNPSQSAASSADIVAAANRVGAFPARSGSSDAAIIVTLAPGAYTAAVSGSNNTTGSGLLEIYELSREER